MAEMNKDAEEKIAQLQLLEQNLQNFLMQKQGLQAQLMEIDSALESMKDSETNYKIVGNIMIKTDKESLKKELEQKKEVIELRLKNIDKQEDRLKDKAKETRDDVLKKMKK